MDSESIVNLEDDVIEFLVSWSSSLTDVDCSVSGNVVADGEVDCKVCGDVGADNLVDVVDVLLGERRVETVPAAPVTSVDIVRTTVHSRRVSSAIPRRGVEAGANIARIHPYGRGKHPYYTGGESSREPSYMAELKAKCPAMYWKLKDSLDKCRRKK